SRLGLWQAGADRPHVADGAPGGLGGQAQGEAVDPGHRRQLHLCLDRRAGPSAGDPAGSVAADDVRKGLRDIQISPGSISLRSISYTLSHKARGWQCSRGRIALSHAKAESIRTILPRGRPSVGTARTYLCQPCVIHIAPPPHATV